jgi:hypothetical protein
MFIPGPRRIKSLAVLSLMISAVARLHLSAPQQARALRVKHRHNGQCRLSTGG